MVEMVLESQEEFDDVRDITINWKLKNSTILAMIMEALERTVECRLYLRNLVTDFR